MILCRDERLVEFSFSSRIDSGLSPDALLRLACQSWSANRRAGVSGFLRLTGCVVEQTVEGPSSRVLWLASRILTDRRHGEIVIRRFGAITARRFIDWKVMGFDARTPESADPRPLRAGLRLLRDGGHAPDLETSPEPAHARALTAG